MTLDFFRAQMARMNGLRFAPADLQTHWEGLRELPEDVLEAAIGRAVRFRIEFPTPIELRQDADQVAPMRPAPAPDAVPLDAPVVLGTLPTGAVITATHTWKYYCEACSDHGVREYWCGQSDPTRQPWIERKRCGGKVCAKLGEGYSHTWVEPCACADWNPEIKRKRARDAKYAAERAAK